MLAEATGNTSHPGATVPDVESDHAPTPPSTADFAKYLASLNPEERERARRKLDTIVRFHVPHDQDAADALRFENLAEIAAEGIEPPAQLVPGMVLEGCVNWFAGHPGHGKTTVVMNAAMQVMRDLGRDVIWLDWEGGKFSTLRRLLAVGVSLELIGERFGYAAYPQMSADTKGFEPLRWALEQRPGAVVVFDSASKALSAAGLDENSPTDATRWTTEVVMPIRDAGGTVIVIDHVPKGAKRNTPYARGAGSKLADTEVMWFVDAEERFNKSTIGKLRLTLHKDREGGPRSKGCASRSETAPGGFLSHRSTPWTRSRPEPPTRPIGGHSAARSSASCVATRAKS